MLLLTIRTDKPEAEIGLFDDSKKIAYQTWQAHRQLAETIHSRIKELLKSKDIALNDIQAVLVFKGPGSFTGLRIGISVANALADSLKIPIITEGGDDWIEQGGQRLEKSGNDKIALPEYGSLPHITKPKH